ncbi:GGDEF domain-containing protein [Acidobacteria bacterium AH-259-G07]|nr:GGDEF domain-containing protein [Acidobacteria bacterium AH-259-G07]
MSNQRDTSASLLKRLLANSILLKGVEIDSIITLLQDGTVQELKQGEVLIQARQSSRVLYLLLSGRLSIHLELKLHPVAILGPGDVVGELSLIDGQLTSAYVVANADCSLLALEEKTVWSLLEAAPGMARNLLFVLARRLRHLTNQELRREYAHGAVIDALTGLYNRRWIETMLVREMEHSKRDGRPLSVLLIGIDHFKRYSKTHGHLAAESMLHAVSSVLEKSTRPGEMIARYRRDEFMLVFPDADARTSQDVGERLLEAIHEAKVFSLDQNSLPSVTVSVGVADMNTADRAETLIAAADAALRDAKEGGGNRVQLVSPP